MIPDKYYDAAANMIWDFGDGIGDFFKDHPEAISPALGLIEDNNKEGLAVLLYNLNLY